MKKAIYLCVAFTALLALGFNAANAQGGVAINAAGAPPDNSAVLDVSSSSKGLLMPRITTAQRNAIASPAKGLFIYNTDCDVVNFNAGTPSSPNWVTMNSSNALTAGVTISASPVGAVCAGTSVTFTATPANGITSPTYQWQVNGANVGTNSTTYTNSNLNTGDIVTCILSTSQNCVTGSPATSNALAITVNPAPSTPGSITGNTTVCENSTGNIYSISPVAGATSYNWTVPGGASIASGDGNTSITVSFGTGSGNITVAAVNSCGTSGASTQAITVTLIPSTPGTISGNSGVCPNATGQVYTINAVSGATSYNWSLPPGAGITVNSDTTITVTFGNSPTGNVAVSASNNCGTSGQSNLSISQPGICPPTTLTYTGSMQVFTVPAGVTSLTIEAWGAQGGSTAGENGTGNWIGGLGADIKGTFSVTPGQTLNVLVGGVGTNFSGGSCTTGGGGGSWVVNSGSLLLVAGGGGGAFNCNYYGGVNGGPGQAGNNGGSGISAPAASGPYPGGTGGNGGQSCYGGGGGGWLSNGANYCGGGTPGLAYPGAATNGGGYGGGGGTYGGCCAGSAGGGGYSGGSGGTSDGSAGGGGGSYNNGTNQTNTAGVQTGNGKVTFTW